MVSSAKSPLEPWGSYCNRGAISRTVGLVLGLYLEASLHSFLPSRHNNSSTGNGWLSSSADRGLESSASRDAASRHERVDLVRALYIPGPASSGQALMNHHAQRS